MFIKAGYVQPTAQVATSNADSIIDASEENQLARILASAQQIMAAPVYEESADAPQPRTQAHANDAADLNRFKNRRAERERASGGFKTPVKPKGKGS